MSSPIIPCSFTYNDIPGGGQFAIIVIAAADPTVSNNSQTLGTYWLNSATGDLFILNGFSSGVPNWVLVSSSSGSIVSVSGTANQITASNSSGDVTLSLPSPMVAPGAITATGAVTATKVNLGTGAAGSTGISSAMVAGTTTVNTTAVTANSTIQLSYKAIAGTPGYLSPGTITPGTSFVINSTSGTDTSTVQWTIFN